MGKWNWTETDQIMNLFLNLSQVVSVQEKAPPVGDFISFKNPT